MKLILQNKLLLAGLVLGAIGGDLYYRFAGCPDGHCAISSNPVNMTLYGALMGGLFFSAFKKETN